MIWTTSDIQTAREQPLAPLLQKRGYDLSPLPGGAYILKDKYPGLVVRGHLWFWRQIRQTGNTIDFLMYLEGQPFAQIMRTLLEQQTGDSTGEEEDDDEADPQTGKEQEDEQTGDEPPDDDLPDWVRRLNPP